MDRLACVSVPAFPLQLLLARHPEWAGQPAAVVAEDRPQAEILWVNERARRAGILPGLTYAAGLGLAPGLRAAAVPANEIAASVASLTARLRRFTPDVEPSAHEPGVFWLGAAGLDRLYPSRSAWARAVRAEVAAAGFEATVVCGFTRFGVYAVARVRRGVVVFADPELERTAAERVPLDRLHLDPGLRDALRKLGITTVGGLLALPAGGLRERFGRQAHDLHRLAAGEAWAPLRREAEDEPVRRHLVLDAPERDATRLLFVIKRLLDPLLADLAARGQALAECLLRLRFERAGERDDRIRPAAATLDAVQILDLIRLRLEAAAFPAGVAEVAITIRGAPATPEQVLLFAERPPRDLDAANRALARLRAEFGDGAAVRARLRDAHLPEARFTWEPVERVVLPRPGAASPSTLVRRILARPVPIPARESVPWDDGWIPAAEYGPVDRMHGPYVIAGGWWRREVHREYYFAETRRGEVLWIYRDRRRRRWFLHGRVE